jgi:hypothetical protein
MIVPPPSAIAFAERWPGTKIVETPSSPEAKTSNAGHGTTKRKIATGEPLKKIVVRRPTPSVKDESAPNYRVQAAPVMRMSLRDIIKERLGQSIFKLN